VTILAPDQSSRSAAPASRWARLSSHPTLLVIVISALAALAAWLRLPAIARDTLWAEDGRNFLQGAIDHGPLASLFIPYAGYLHTVPRLIASAVVSWLPLADWALGMTAGACLVAGILAGAVFVATRALVRWLPARIALASLVVLAPLAPREVLGNAANLHSLFLFALFWIALARPRGRRETVGLSIVALLGALTEVQSLFLLPLLLIRLRDRRRWPVRAALVVGVVAQLVVAVVFPRGGSGSPQDSPLSIAYGYLINAVMPLAVPQLSIGPVVAATGPLVGILLVIPLTGALLFVLRRGSLRERQVAIALAAGSVLIYVASVVANPHPFYDYAALSHSGLVGLWLVRYGVVPSMMLAAIPILALAVAMTRRHRPSAAALLAMPALVILCVALAGSLLMQFVPQDTRRSAGPAWQPQLSAATKECRALPDDSRVLIAETITWHVSLPCDDLTPDRPRPIR
jgi:hypothetical protein